MKSNEYEKITLPFRKTINELNANISDLCHEKQTLINENNNLKLENEQLKDWVNRLLEYTNMSEADIKASIEKDKAMADGAKALSFLMSVANMF